MSNAQLQKKANTIALLQRIKDKKKSIPTKNRILALDPAENFGWAISNHEYGVWQFKLKRDENFAMKLLRFKSKLIEIVSLENINIIIFERPSGRMPSAIMSHAKFVAVIEMFCQEKNIASCGYSAKEIKKFATGKGNAGKPLMIKAAQEKLGYVGNDDNECDALWILNYAKFMLDL